MKKFLKSLIYCLFPILILSDQSMAQSPDAFKYQAVLRNVSNTPIASQAVSIRISILEEDITGSVVYQEVHAVTTSPLGLINLNIGEGTTSSGIFSDINWESADHFLQVELDESGGSNYYLLGASQLLSVPYALYAKEAGKVELIAGEGISIIDNEITNANPSPWQEKDSLIFVDSSFVGIGINDSTPFPENTHLFINGNVKVADDSSLSGIGKIVGFDDIRFAGSPNRTEDMIIASNGRVTFTEEVGINQTFSFIDLNVRNQPGNSTVFNVEDTSGTDIFRVGRDGNVGINQLTNNVTLNVRNKSLGTNNIILNVERANGDNVLQVQDDQDVVITGDFSVNSGAKNFILDHPLDPANKVLAHNAVESPGYITYYDGMVTLDKDGAATVQLPDYFEALNADFRYQLTCVGGFAQVYIAKEIQDNQFMISGGKSGMKVSWQVSARRNDPWAHDHPYQVEREKRSSEKGQYYYPEGYGKDRAYKIGANQTNDKE